MGFSIFLKFLYISGFLIFLSACLCLYKRRILFLYDDVMSCYFAGCVYQFILVMESLASLRYKCHNLTDFQLYYGAIKKQLDPNTKHARKSIV